MKKTLRNMVEYLYSKLLISYNSGKKPRFYLALYLIWEKFFKNYNPEIKIKIGTKFLFMNLSHKLPIYYNKFPFYDRALPRIAKKLKDIDNELNIIDIGANIGDTVSLVTDMVDANFLCIEGDENFLSILERNLKQISKNNNIKIERSYCGDSIDIDVCIDIFRSNGTAKITKRDISNNTKNKIGLSKIKSLDKILEENLYFAHSNLLKIDTDGFEINILNGGKIFLKKINPLIFIEFTPELYINNNQNPDSIWSILIECGYDKALFYDNFGNPIKIIDINNKFEISNLVNKIDKKSIYYYDVLLYNKNKNEYLNILNSELINYENNNIR